MMNDRLRIAAMALLATAEGIIDDLKAQLTAALEDNERLNTEAQRLRELFESGAGEIAALKAADSHCLCRADVWQLEQQVAALKRQMAPLTEEEALGICDSTCNQLGPEHVQIIDRAIDAALSACDESPWRSMESAPKNGAWILACNVHRAAVVQWDDGDWWGHDGSGIEPTHWMPLPAAPEVGK